MSEKFAGEAMVLGVALVTKFSTDTKVPGSLTVSSMVKQACELNGLIRHDAEPQLDLGLFCEGEGKWRLPHDR